jgi:hypothetical protein
VELEYRVGLPCISSPHFIAGYINYRLAGFTQYRIHSPVFTSIHFLHQQFKLQE